MDKKAKVSILFPRRSKGVLEKKVKHVAVASPFSVFVKTPEEDGTLFRYMFPTRGYVTDFTINVEQSSGNPQAIMRLRYTGENATLREFLTPTLNQGIIHLNNFDVSAGELLQITLLPKSEQTITNLWFAFSFKHHKEKESSDA